MQCSNTENYCYALRPRIINPFLPQGKWKFVRIVELSDKELWNEFQVFFTTAFTRNLSFIQRTENSNCCATDLAGLLDLRNDNSASEHQFFTILNFSYRRLNFL